MDGISAVSAIASLVVLGGKISIEAHGFFSRMKDCPKRVRNVGDELESIISILEQLEKALQAPANTGVFSLRGKEEQFTSCMKGLEEVFMELSTHMKKYGKPSGKMWSLSSLRRSSRWAATGMGEAVQLSRSLSHHKDSLSVTLQLTQCETLAAIDHRGVDAADTLRIMMSVMSVQASAKGINDPRLNGWLESVADYTGSTMAPEDAATIPQDYSPVSSTISLLDVVEVAQARARTDEEKLSALERKRENLEYETQQLRGRIRDKTLVENDTDSRSGPRTCELPQIDPETEKKLLAQQEDIARQFEKLGEMRTREAEQRAKLTELENFIMESKAREQRMKDDAERTAEMAKSIAETVARAKAEMVAAHKAKDIVDLQAIYLGGSAAAADAEAQAMEAASHTNITSKQAKDMTQSSKQLSRFPGVNKERYIKFMDVLGRRFKFPFVLCRTWDDIRDLVKRVFADVDLPVAGAVQDGKYDLIGPNGQAIRPQIWEMEVRPKWSITMKMWPAHTWTANEGPEIEVEVEVEVHKSNTQTQHARTEGKKKRPSSAMIAAETRLDKNEVSFWSSRQVGIWMLHAGLEPWVIEKLEENDISGAVLITLKLEDLLELGIRSWYQRSQILDEIGKLKYADSSAPSPPPPSSDGLR